MKEHLSSIIYMFIVTFFFAAAVSAVRQVSLERIKVNEQAKITGVILDVLSIQHDRDMDAAALVQLFEQRVRTVTIGAKTLYVSVAENGKDTEGYAFEVSGPGFWGPIYGIAALDAKGERMLGIRFYKHTETPGLGARISEKWFTDQFRSLPVVQPGKDGKFFALKPPGKSRAAHELNAITGATMTSQAVEKFLNRDLRDVVAKINTLLKEDG